MDPWQQAALADMRRVLLADGDPATSLAHVAGIVADVLATDHSMILEALADQSSLVLRAGVGWEPGTLDQITLDPGAMRELAAPGTPPLIVGDWRSETRRTPPRFMCEQGIISTLWTAIPGLERPFGILGVGSVQPRTWSQGESQFVQTAAGLLGLALERTSSRATENALLIAAAQDQAVLEERQRLARDLHDSVTQAIYGVTLHAEAATRLLSSGDLVTVAHYLRKLQETAQEALEEMRLLIFELRPPVLDQEGLVAALQARLGAVEGRANLQTTLVAEGVTRLAAPVEQALYRIAQEALNNALKHAHATHISVSLQQQGSTVIMLIADDGLGFDPATAREQGRLGLCGIAERVAQVGGELRLTSTPGAGTQLRVEVTV
jgi:signal transduction histidine kinase